MQFLHNLSQKAGEKLDYVSADGLSVDDLSVDSLSVDDLSVDDLRVDDLRVDGLFVDYLPVDDLIYPSVRGVISSLVRSISNTLRLISRDLFALSITTVTPP